MSDQGVDQVFRLGTDRIHARQSFVAGALTAEIGLLIWIKLRIDKEAVLKVINPEFGSLFVRHRAEVAGHLDSTFVRRINCRLQFRARDVHVRLKRGNSTIGPVLYRLPRVVGTGKVRHLEKVTLSALEVRTGDIEMRTGKFAGINIVL